MSLITILLGIAILGLIVYLLEQFIPMADPFKILIRVIAAIVVILWIVNAFGLPLPALPRFR